jgi:hypothetical protein
MALAPDDTRLPSLFTHTTRKDWGVGVLAWDDGGKRGYLFENGAERTMASGFHELMRKVEQPSPDQKAASLRLQGVLTARAKAQSSPPASGPSFSKQLASFHESYPAGLLDAKWVEEIRGEGAPQRAPQHRAPLVKEAQEQLASTVLDSLLSGQRFEKVWDLVISVLGHTDLVPAAQLKKLKSAHSEHQRELAVATRELLHGKGAYEQRFDRYVAALAAHSGEPTRWEVATALSALVHPTEHLCVNPAVLRQQLKAIGSRATAPARPTSAGYTRLMAVARAVAKKLTEQGDVPRDMLDVHDFMRITLKAPAKARAPSARPSARRVAPKVADDEEQDD